MFGACHALLLFFGDTEVGAAAASGIAVLTWLATVAFAEVLRRNGKRGPAETLLRRLTYR